MDTARITQALVITACICSVVTSSPLAPPRHWPNTLARVRRGVPVSSYALPVEIENKFDSPTLLLRSSPLAPLPLPPGSTPGQDKIATTIVQEEMLSPDGTFSIRYQTSNGITTEMKGSPKGNLGQSMEGSFSYTAPDGSTITTRWTADETGFHPEGDHLPTFVLKSG